MEDHVERIDKGRIGEQKSKWILYIFVVKNKHKELHGLTKMFMSIGDQY